ncbi:MAG: hypothetical protein ACFCU9_14745, partial [Cyanophyceae cyanobacterium]
VMRGLRLHSSVALNQGILMTDEERFDKLADAIERVADASSSGIQMLTQAQLATQHQIGLMSAEMIRLGKQVEQVSAQQAAMQVRQAEQDQRFDVLLGEIRHIVQRLDDNSAA